MSECLINYSKKWVDAALRRRKASLFALGTLGIVANTKAALLATSSSSRWLTRVALGCRERGTSTHPENYTCSQSRTVRQLSLFIPRGFPHRSHTVSTVRYLTSASAYM